MTKKKFHIGTIFSGYQDKFVSPLGLQDLQDLYKFLFGESLLTHELCLKESYTPMHQELLKQIPWLSEIDYSPINPDTWRVWLDNQIEKYGEYQEVTVSKENLDRKNPITTFVENFKGNGGAIVYIY